MRKGRAIALLPIAVFLVLYLGLGILFEYVMKIPMGFYNVPIVFAFLVAISAAHELGYDLSAFQIMPKLFYPILLLFSSLVFIFLVPQKRK